MGGFSARPAVEPGWASQPCRWRSRYGPGPQGDFPARSAASWLGIAAVSLELPVPTQRPLTAVMLENPKSQIQNPKSPGPSVHQQRLAHPPERAVEVMHHRFDQADAVRLAGARRLHADPFAFR